MTTPYTPDEEPIPGFFSEDRDPDPADDVILLPGEASTIPCEETDTAPDARPLGEPLEQQPPQSSTQSSATAPVAALRDQLRQTLRESFTWHITAEWICCDPPAKGHDLCKQGHAALEMVSALLDDDPASQPQRSPILDAVMHVIESYALAITVDATRRADELAGRLQQAERERDFALAAMPTLDRAETAERQHAEALDQIATERRGRLAAEAAVRRVRQVLAWKTLLAGPQAEKAARVADVEAALDAEQPKEPPRRLTEQEGGIPNDAYTADDHPKGM